MSRYGVIANTSQSQSVFIQSADPVDMQTRVNAALAALAPTALIVEINLVGAGDGHTFVMEIVHAAVPADPVAGPYPVSRGLLVLAGFLRIRCFVAGDAQEFQVQRARAIAGVTGNLIDEFTAGGSKGTRIMGVIVEATLGGVLPFTPVGNIGGDGLGNPIVAGDTMLIGAAGAGINTVGGQQMFRSPAAGILEYTGSMPLSVAVNAGVTLSLAVEFAATLQIISDPLGTPIVERSISFALVAGLIGHVGLAAGQIPLNPGAQLALRIANLAAGGSGTLVGAYIAAIPSVLF
jgi:hypothetical protein